MRDTLEIPRGVRSVDELATHLNKSLRRIAELLAGREGVDNRVVTMANRIDMGGHPVTNAGRSQKDSDLVTRRELRDSIQELGVTGAASVEVTGQLGPQSGGTGGGLRGLGGGGGGLAPATAPIDAAYALISADARLALARILTAGANVSLTDNGPGNTFVIAATGSATSSHTHVSHEVPTGATTVWTMAATPDAGTEQVFVNGVELRRVAAAPGLGEYSIAAAVLTLGWSLGGSDTIWTHYETSTGSTHSHVFHNLPIHLTGNTYQLAATPTTGSEQLFLNGVQLRRVASAPGSGEYSISGDTLTTGWALDGTDKLWAHYLV